MRALGALFVLALVGSACTAGSPTTTEPLSSTPSGTGGSPGGLTCWSAPASGGEQAISFDDVTEALGLVDPLIGMKGHSAAWGDINDDGLPDIVVGTFATARGEVYLQRGATGPSPDRLLLSGDTFTLATGFPEELGRTSGLVFADLDNDGDDDLVLSRNVVDDESGAPTEVMERTGDGWKVADSGIDASLGGRSVGILDVDSDGLLDLLILVDRYRGGDSRLYRNVGGMRFEDMSAAWGFPDDVDGLGIATGDLNGDGRTDVFVAGSNRLFVGTGEGLVEVVGAIPAWETYGNEDDVAGAAMADVNRDGLLDLVVGQHYNSTLSRGVEVPVRLYLNRTEPGGEIRMTDVTDEAGLIGLPTKAPHVELVDFDNDGWLDLLTTASADNGTRPAIFHNIGLDNGVPIFETPQGLGSAQYWVAGPTADFDRDGRVDVFLVEWEPSLPSLLLRNETASGHWVEVSVGPELGGGVGTRVDVYESGKAGNPEALLGSREIVASLGYSAGVERIAHFGLGDVTEVDLVVSPPLPAEPVTIAGQVVDQHVRFPSGCH